MASLRRIRVVADEMLPVADYLPALDDAVFDVRSIPGREITAGDLNDTDVLLVRSITRVDRELLHRSAVSYVGSATIGIDHVDTRWLAEQDIGFGYAPGCNANAVVDYVVATMLAQFGTQQFEQLTVGIAGYGNVGSRLASLLDNFGVGVKIYDPFVDVPARLAATSIQQLLGCDVISLHVPLSTAGLYPTHHLIDEAQLSALDASTLLINSSRGAVVNNRALLERLKQPLPPKVALDVWEGEPQINTELLDSVDFATGHIAGYSEAGRQRGLKLVIQAMRDALGIGNSTAVNEQGLRGSEALSNYRGLADYLAAVSSNFDAHEETAAFRDLLKEKMGSNIATAFDRYRRNYSLRKEIDYSALLRSDSDTTGNHEH